MKYNVTRVRAIITDGTEVLLVRQKHSQSWRCLPGGGVEPGEDIISALRREIIEELGVEPVIGKLMYVQQFKMDGQTFVPPEFFFHVTNTDDFRSIDLTATTHGELELAEVGFYVPSEVEELRPEFLADPGALDVTADTKLIIRED